MPRPNAVTRLPWFLLLALACQATPEERFPPAPDGCTRGGCEPGPVRPIGGGPTGASPTSTDAGTAPTPTPTPTPSDAPDGGAATPSLRGSVAVANSVDLQNLVDLDDVRVRVEAVSPDGSSTEASVGRGEQFDLPVSGYPVRVTVRQASGEPSLINTIQWLDRGQDVALVLERLVVQDIADALTAAPLLDAERAHALITLVDAAGNPRSGASVSISEGVVGYDIGFLYSDAEEQTAERGGVVLINVPAGPLPGTAIEVRARLAGQSQSFPLHVAQDSVTLQRWQL